MTGCQAVYMAMKMKQDQHEYMPVLILHICCSPYGDRI